jgi:hypothetical protein
MTAWRSNDLPAHIALRTMAAVLASQAVGLKAQS